MNDAYTNLDKAAIAAALDAIERDGRVVLVIDGTGTEHVNRYVRGVCRMATEVVEKRRDGDYETQSTRVLLAIHDREFADDAPAPVLVVAQQ